MGVIYLRTNKINRKKYIGQATDLKTRQRKWNCMTQDYAGVAINRARAKYGIDAFDFEILMECKDEELNQWEMYYIKELNTKIPNGYNMTDGGGGSNGYSLSEEHKKKISEAHKGKKMPPFTEEHRRKLTESQIGEKHWNYGNHLSEEHKKKISETLSKPVFQIDKKTDKIIAEFTSAAEVKRQLGVSNGHITECCLGKRKTAYGYIWRYKEDAA